MELMSRFMIMFKPTPSPEDFELIKASANEHQGDNFAVTEEATKELVTFLGQRFPNYTVTYEDTGCEPGGPYTTVSLDGDVAIIEHHEGSK